MGDSAEFRGWEELIPDALGLIFRNLSLQEILTVVPRVCKSWALAVAGPYCWREIDIEEWSLRCKPEQLDRLLRMLITRSCGSFQKLVVSGLPNDSLFSFIAEHAGSLQTLELPRSEISDSMVEHVSPQLSNITFLDVSYCKNIGPRALEAIGRHCKSLVGLRRTMHPLEVVDKVSQDDEAFAIASSMTKLRHLEMAYVLITTRGVLEILSQCKELQFLDLRGCWEVELDEKLLEERHAGVTVLGPDVEDLYERNYFEGYYSEGDFSDSTDYSWKYLEDGLDSDEEVGVWDADAGLEGLEVRFYGSGFNQAYAGFHWPPSP